MKPHHQSAEHTRDEEHDLGSSLTHHADRPTHPTGHRLAVTESVPRAAIDERVVEELTDAVQTQEGAGRRPRLTRLIRHDAEATKVSLRSSSEADLEALA